MFSEGSRIMKVCTKFLPKKIKPWVWFVILWVGSLVFFVLVSKILKVIIGLVA